MEVPAASHYSCNILQLRDYFAADAETLGKLLELDRLWRLRHLGVLLAVRFVPRNRVARFPIFLKVSEYDSRG